MWIYTNPGAPYLSEEFLAQSLELFQKAEAAAEDEVTKTRVRKGRLSIDYVRLMRAKAFEVRNGFYAPLDVERLKENFQSFLSDVRSFGITELHEGSKLSEDEENFSELVKPYRVATLENAFMRVDVAPELSGRIIRMVDRRSGHDVLRRPDPGERSYPDVGGLNVSAYSDYLGLPYDATWELEPQSEAAELRLTSLIANGLKASRVFRLGKDERYLRTETTLENGAASALEVVLQSRCVVGLKSMEAPESLHFTRQDGKFVRETLITPGEEPRGSKVYNGPEQPDGQWTVSGVGDGLVVANRFPKDQVSRCVARWTGKTENSLTLGIWSAKRTLAPGEALKLETDYGIISSG